MTTPELPPLPCPFCGDDNISVREGSGFRWRVAFCTGCDAQAGEVRAQTSGPGTPDEWERTATVDAIAEWNKRDTAEVDRLRQTVAWLRGLIATVVERMEREDGSGPDAPGHCHEKPGVWDADNRREIAGKPCEWCHIWSEFKAAGAGKVETCDWCWKSVAEHGNG